MDEVTHVPDSTECSSCCVFCWWFPVYMHQVYVDLTLDINVLKFDKNYYITVDYGKGVLDGTIDVLKRYTNKKLTERKLST